MTTDYLGNEIKEGMEICSITVRTGGYFGGIEFWTPMQYGVHSVTKIHKPKEENCWVINYCEKVEKLNGMLCTYSESKEISGYTPLDWLNTGSKEIIAIKGVSDSEEMYLKSITNVNQ